MDSLFMESTAAISPCGTWRYRLTRRWNKELRVAVFIMLNPSTADADKEDPTIRKCMGFAEKNGLGGIEIYNLFAYRTTNPKILGGLTTSMRVGPENDDYLRAINRYSGTLVYAWGNTLHRMPWFQQRVDEIRGLFSERPAYCVKQTSGEPWHPLYVPYGEFKLEGL